MLQIWLKIRRSISRRIMLFVHLIGSRCCIFTGAKPAIDTTRSRVHIRNIARICESQPAFQLSGIICINVVEPPRRNCQNLCRRDINFKRRAIWGPPQREATNKSHLFIFFFSTTNFHLHLTSCLADQFRKLKITISCE